MASEPADAAIDHALASVEKVRDHWHRQPGVTAVDVGFKITDGVMTDEVSLRVHVERKIPIEELPERQRFNESGAPTAEVEGVPVDVIEANYGILRNEQVDVPSLDEAPDPSLAPGDADPEAALAVDRRSVVRPVVGGVSCGNPRASAGTVGAIVHHRATGKPMILSNWHVLAADRAAAIGEPILQPGRSDGGRTADRVASLSAMVLDQRMDAAIAELDTEVVAELDLVGLGPISGVATPRLGMLVAKSGRTTALTEGVVDGLSLSTTISYRNGAVQSFLGQIRIVPRPPWPAVNSEISSGGDSGSVWIDPSTNLAVGLHFAGETDAAISAENAIASPIGPVLDTFDVGFGPIADPTADRDRPRPRSGFDLCARFPFLCDETLGLGRLFRRLRSIA